MAYSPSRMAIKYIRHYLTASSGRGHGIHSPFVYDLVRSVLIDKRQYYAYRQVEALRLFLLHRRDKIEVEDLGAGSSAGIHKILSISEIARKTAKPEKWAKLLFRLVHHYQPQTMIELGTSLGISTAYLSLANPFARITTIEGSAEIAARAAENFRYLDLKNIAQLVGNFDTELPRLLPRWGGAGLVFVDGNHRKEPTLAYFDLLLQYRQYPGLIIFDDIHWSKGMEEAWERIVRHPDVLLSIDLFFFGLVFFRDEFKHKQHFRIRF